MNECKDFKPIPTRASLALGGGAQQKTNEFKAIIFEEPKFMKTTKPPSSEPSKVEDDGVRHRRPPTEQKDEAEEFDIKKARHEVLNFAIDNQRTIKNQKKMLAFKAVKLGAKPAKKAYKNYKDLLDEKKRLKDIREERKKFHRLGKNQTGLASVKCRSKTKIEKQQKKRLPVTSIDLNYGVAKGGAIKKRRK